MYRLYVTGHKAENDASKHGRMIPIIKAFRFASGMGLKECKDYVTSMIGIQFDYSAPPYDGRVKNVSRNPYELQYKDRVKAELRAIEFRMHGFTTEVKKVG